MRSSLGASGLKANFLSFLVASIRPGCERRLIVRLLDHGLEKKLSVSASASTIAVFE